jgi:hypothetical protein
VSIVVMLSARETFTPRELTAAHKEFKERGAQYLRPSENTAFPAIPPTGQAKTGLPVR